MTTEEPREKRGKYYILPKIFSEKGWKFSLLQRRGDVAIYCKDKSGNKNFEVVKINRHEGYKIADNYVEPAEIYPSSEQWGTNGWSYSVVEKAYEKFNTLLK